MTVQTPLVKSEQAAMIGANRNARKAGIMPTLPTSQSQYFDTAVFNAQVPKEGPKAMGVTAAFGNGPGQAAEYDINLYLTQAQQYMTQVSSVFVDNSENASQVEIDVSVINQTLKMAAHSQGYLPIFVPKNAQIKVSSAGTANVSFIFANVPLPAAVWGGLT